MLCTVLIIGSILLTTIGVIVKARSVGDLEIFFASLLLIILDFSGEIVPLLKVEPTHGYLIYGTHIDISETRRISYNNSNTCIIQK